ncbi:hypothetical protein E2C01_020014 [Portunus trituberculatus]|uniref:Uncharacterized protein n=1 Tax=Portunus trituberculatus TaxID=210409 RepID=A0A5B7E0Y4_PORTR|nr:hypothetical protein [Portunus trituberculatus]
MSRHAHARSASCVVLPVATRVPVPAVLSLASFTTLDLPPDCSDQQVGVVVCRSVSSGEHCGGGVAAAAVVTVTGGESLFKATLVDSDAVKVVTLLIIVCSKPPAPLCSTPAVLTPAVLPTTRPSPRHPPPHPCTAPPPPVRSDKALPLSPAVPLRLIAPLICPPHLWFLSRAQRYQISRVRGGDVWRKLYGGSSTSLFLYTSQADDFIESWCKSCVEAVICVLPRQGPAGGGGAASPKRRRLVVLPLPPPALPAVFMRQTLTYMDPYDCSHTVSLGTKLRQHTVGRLRHGPLPQPRPGRTVERADVVMVVVEEVGADGQQLPRS